MPTDSDRPTETRAFSDFGIDAALCDALTDAGITEPFPIQELTLPMALSGADVIGQARTGTGKTLAFGLPALQRVAPEHRHVQVLVIVPTRELCLQVTGELEQATTRLDLSLVAVFGGRPIEPQAQALAHGAHVVVGTPGRLLDVHQRGMLDLSGVATLVLDEADEMLDLGFLPDVEHLIGLCPAQRQTLLFSATMPSPVVALARRYMSKPTFVRAEEDRSALSPDTSHAFLSCHRLDKPAVLARILQAPDRGLCLVFTRTKRMADQLAKELADREVDAAAIHSDLRQEARERALRRFREGKVTVLVATEVAARGLDIDHVTHVVNYDCPDDEKMYLHRIGRTGRAGAAGAAVTLAVWNELARLEMIKKALNLGDQPTHEVFSTSTLLDELFNLPPAQTPARSRQPDRKGPSGGDAASGPAKRGQGQSGKRRRGGRGRSGRTRAGDGDGTGDQATSGDRADTGDRAASGDGADAGDRAASGDGTDTADRDGQGDQAQPAPGQSAASGGDSGEAQPAPDTPASSPAHPTATETTRPTGQRQRTRTRTRTTTAGGRAASGSQQPGSPSDDAPGQSGTRAQKRAGGQSPRARQGGDAKSRRGGGRGDADAKTTGKADQGKPGGGRRGGKRQGGRSGGRGRPAVSPTEARGSGQPRIRRPLQVEHLP
jgi:superfamily II DNA/RNA helicase